MILQPTYFCEIDNSDFQQMSCLLSESKVYGKTKMALWLARLDRLRL